MFRKLLTLMTICSMLAVPGVAQNPNQPQPQTATTLAFPLLFPPSAPASLNIQTSGAPGPSSSTVFYWLVADFPIGNSTPAGPFQAFNVPATLSGGNFEILNWPPVAGALSYDVLKTTTNVAPTGACGCLVANTSSTTLNDQSNSTTAYTVNTFAATTVLVQLDNEATGTPGIAALTARQNGALYNYVDGQYVVIPSDCSMFTTAGAFTANSAGAGTVTGPAMVRVAANNWVLQGITTAVANSIAVLCDLNPMSRNATGRGALITGIQVFYGVQTTALTSITPPTLASVTYPATGAAAGVTVAGVPGSLTVTPGTLQLATTTSGQCYSENITLTTPFAMVSKLQRLNLEQIFNQSAAAATQLQFCGAIVYYSDFPL